MKGAKLQALFEIFLIISSVVAVSYFVSDVFGSKGIVSAQSADIPQEWRDAFPGEPDELLQQRIDRHNGNLGRAQEEWNLVRGEFSDYDAFLQDQATIEQTGQLSDAFLNLIGFFETIIPNFASFFGGGLFDQGVSVCTVDDDQAICQVYLSSECSSHCEGECIPAPNGIASMPAGSACELGMCYDSTSGTCTLGGNEGGGATRDQCEATGGTFYRNLNEDGAEMCQIGCCFLGDQSKFIRQGLCMVEIENVGGDLDSGAFRFDPSITNEIICQNALLPEAEGACTFPSTSVPDKNDCRFISATECVESGGDFHEGKLCSHEELNTVCERQDTVQCLEGFDEVYFVDSCGNRENIYDADRGRSFNGGFVLPKDESCSVGSSADPIANQATCGNCDRLANTFCAERTEGDGIIPAQEIPGFDVVCRDMGCYETDLLGIVHRRDHDESWCAYQSSIGLPGHDNLNLFGMSTMLPQNPLNDLLGGGGGAYSTDTPGSRHFRKYCQNGDIKTAPCDDFRNEVCVEQRTPKGINEVSVDPTLITTDPQEYFRQVDAWAQNLPNVDFLDTFSQASCQTSRWGECFAYNPDMFESRLIGMAGSKAGDLLKLKLDTTCGLDPDCFVKTVDLTSGDSDTFKFSYCAPRYAPGFGFNEEEAETGENFCSQGNSACTAVFVKKAKAGGFAGAEWECEANCDCVDYNDGDEPDSAKPSQEFTNQMNALCVSLGDCGNQVNYLENQPGGKGYKVCMGEDGECKGGFAGIGGDPLGDVLGGFGLGGTAALGNAQPDPLEYIPAQNTNVLGDILGDSIGKFLDDLGLGGLFDQFEGQLGGGAGVPNVPSSTNLGSSAGVGLGVGTLGGISGAMGVPYAIGGAKEVASWTVTFSQPLANNIALTPGSTTVIKGAETFVATTGQTVTHIPAGTTTITTTNVNFANTLVSGQVSGGNVGTAAGGSVQSTGAISGTVEPGTSVVSAPATASSVAAGFAASIIGGVAGSAITSFLVDALGIGAGLDPVTATVLTTAGGVAGSFGATAIAHNAGWLTAPTWMGPVAIGMAVAIVTYAVVLKIMGVGEVKEIDVIFECQRWVPPVNGDCAICGEDGLSDGSSSFPCSKYSCETIGQNCEFVEDSEIPEEGGQCIVNADLDVFPPRVVNVLDEYLTDGLSYEGFEENQRVDIVSTGGNCISQFEYITFGLALDEAGRCRMSAAPPTLIDQFDGMREVGGLDDEHIITFRGLDLPDLGYQGDLTSEQQNDITLYIACEDYHERNNALNAFEVNLCITPQDISAPNFPTSSVTLDPVAFDAETFDFTVLVNEDAQCRYGESYMSFDEMSPDTECFTSEGLGGGRLPCNFNDIPIGDGDICIKCVDGRGNENQQCLTVTVPQSESPLSVSLVEPVLGSSFTFGVEPAALDLVVATSGGAYGGEATCRYVNNDVYGDTFQETGSVTHRQTLNQLYAGGYGGTITCDDGVNPEASVDFSFSVTIDKTAPLITRVFDESGTLNLVTDKSATCAYTTRPVSEREYACDFHVSEAGETEGVHLMSVAFGSEGLRHQTPFGSQLYFVKCMSGYGVESSECEKISQSGGQIVQESI